MRRFHRDHLLACMFAVMLALGLAIVVYAAFVQARPYFQLDVVLSQGELKDDALRQKTLEALKTQYASRGAEAWLAAGAVFVLISGLGLVATHRERPRPAARIDEAQLVDAE